VKIKIGRIRSEFGRTSVEYEFDYGKRGWLHFPGTPSEEEIINALKRLYKRSQPTAVKREKLQSLLKLQGKELTFEE